MTDNYNGWTNYATWRIMLEVFDGMKPEDLGGEVTAETIRDHLDLLLDDEAGESLAKSYANAFVSNVNYYEIAEAINGE